MGPAGVAFPGRSGGRRAEGPRAGPVRGPGYRHSRWGWEGAWEVPPGTSPSRAASAGRGWSGGTTSMATSCWGVPEDPHPHGPLSAPNSLGKGGEPSRAMAPLGESVPVSPRRTLSPSHCPIHPHTEGKALPVAFLHSSPLLSQPLSCSRSAAGSRGTDGLGWEAPQKAGQKAAPQITTELPKRTMAHPVLLLSPASQDKHSPDQHLSADGKANLIPERVRFLLNGE